MKQQEKEKRLTVLPLVARLRREPSQTGWASTQQHPRPLSRVQPLALTEHSEQSILDFDIETVAAGFADPDWVPQKITCVAWSWVGSDKVESLICTPRGLFGDPTLRTKMLESLLAEIAKADMLTGHNIERFDLPVINAECMRLGLRPIEGALVQDTMRVYRAKGFKKGQDVMGELFGTATEKFSLNWQGWQDGYDEDGWETIKKRAESDVVMHKQLRTKLLEHRYLMEPRKWRGRR